VTEKNNSKSGFIAPHILKTAVLFLVFNRFDTTKQVFEAIREAKPPRLYIAADGARETKEGEKEKVQAVRDYIIKNIDWECEVKTLFREQNLGCKMAVSSGIDWFFQNEEMGIILEDDILPSQSFFWFCEELLDRYKDDMRVGQISGFNYGYKDANLNYDYIFSKYPVIWGWASWKNRWKNYSLSMDNLEETIRNKQFSLIFKKSELIKRINRFRKAKENKIDTWDYQWAFTLYKNSQFTIIPKRNYILNIGFGNDSTHTSGGNPYKSLSLDDNYVVMKHPDYIVQHKNLDKKINKSSNIIQRIINKVNIS